MEPIDLLVTLDNRYLPQLHTLLTSIYINNPGENFRVWLMHRGVLDSELAPVRNRCRHYGYLFTPVRVDNTLFSNAPCSRQYPKEMYDRMLACHLLPLEVKKIIYLDPDTLVINPIRPLWETDMDGCLFAAAAHSGKTELVHSVNRVRLKTDCAYYNSGVLMMDLEKGRREILPEKLFSYAEEHASELLLPDQDMLNALFGHRILPLDDMIWNYDARDYNSYYLYSGGKCDLDWVLNNTVILHFCGKSKPWKKGYLYRFGLLYKHYARLSRQGQ